jgi:leader peptidase (prepilin peptidase) / N-methyltransferase
MPIEIRLMALFLLGTCLGAAVNWAIYTLAWHPRPISPWARHARGLSRFSRGENGTIPLPPRRLWDRVPVFGWIALRRESTLHGRGFWIRPMLVELAMGLGLAWLYCVTPAQTVFLFGAIPWQPPLAPNLQIIWHLEFVAYAVLGALMLAASLIDVDEMIIPDAITVPGTLIGLLLSAACPWSRLPDAAPGGPAGVTLGFLHLTSPNPWSAALDGGANLGPLCLGLACWWAWCAAILPFLWRPRHGLRRAAQLAAARLRRQPTTYRILHMAMVGSLAIAWVWYRGGDGWKGLLSALVGMAAGGGVIWLVRILGSAALGREAMGFGDVTLMAMIGAFLGWQPCLVIFFLAPLAGLVVGLARWILRGRREIPYGPFLCLATLALIVGWGGIWREVSRFFELGWLVPLAMLFCLLLMAVMLIAWRLILGLFR